MLRLDVRSPVGPTVLDTAKPTAPYCDMAGLNQTACRVSVMLLCHANSVGNPCKTEINDCLHKTRMSPLFVSLGGKENGPPKFPKLCVNISCYQCDIRAFAFAIEGDEFVTELLLQRTGAKVCRSEW